MSTTDDLNLPQEQLAAICERYGVLELSVFGSVARGEAGETSDIDLLVLFDEDAGVGLFALARLQRELTGLFGRKVDLVPKDGLKSALRREVLAQAEVLYAA